MCYVSPDTAQVVLTNQRNIESPRKVPAAVDRAFDSSEDDDEQVVFLRH